jgi:hypothetical protein
MNFGTLVKVFDTAVALGSMASRTMGSSPRARTPSTSGSTQTTPATTTPTTSLTDALDPQPAPGVRGYLETRLANVLVVALKEAFDRDHARLELERAELDEQRRRAERALQVELWRQAAERELGRLKLLAGTALIGWIAAVAVLVVRLESASIASRVVMAVAWMLLLGALGTAFTAQGRVNNFSADAAGPPDAGRHGVAAPWLLLVGLALAAGSLLF